MRLEREFIGTLSANNERIIFNVGIDWISYHSQEYPELPVHGNHVTISENELGLVHFLALQDNCDLLSCN